jgi:ATP-dependent helicase YprA (DUF1998 family)
MSINPVMFAREVNKQFLRYQMTAFPLTDPDMAAQARAMLGNESSSQLIKGPYISLSRTFADGPTLKEMVDSGRLHPVIGSKSPYPRLFAHQERTIGALERNEHCLISTGTGSGKTEAFLYPIVDHCLRQRDAGRTKGIKAIIVYPMNALAQDQLERLRGLLAGTGVTFGMYVGSTPRDDSELSNVTRMEKGHDMGKLPEYSRRFSGHKGMTFVPWEERITEQEMREDPPMLMLTNVNQLEYLLTRGKDLFMFEKAPIRFLVFDEAHTYTGSRGAEVAVLIRRLRVLCERSVDDLLCIGTSATITDPSGGDEDTLDFASRFFGVPREKVRVVREVYKEQEWGSPRFLPDPFGDEAQDLFDSATEALSAENGREEVSKVIKRISKHVLGENWREQLYQVLRGNDVIKVIFETFNKPKELREGVVEVWQRLGRGDPDENAVYEVLCYLALGAAAEQQGNPLLKPQIHYFVRGMGGAAAVLGEKERRTHATLYFNHHSALEKEDVLPTGVHEVLTCVRCGQHYYASAYSDVIEGQGLNGGLAEGDNNYWAVSEVEGVKLTFTDRFVSEEQDIDDPEEQAKKLDKGRMPGYICRRCGALHSAPGESCSNPNCHHPAPLLLVHVMNDQGGVRSCPACGHRGRKWVSRPESLKPLRAVTVADVHILAQEMINAPTVTGRKLLIFADNRQDAAFQAAWMQDHARRYRLRSMINGVLTSADASMSIGDVQRALIRLFEADKDLARELLPEVFLENVEERYSVHVAKELEKVLRIHLLRELATNYPQRDSLESWGKLGVEYDIHEDDGWIVSIASRYGLERREVVDGVSTLLDMYRRSRVMYDPKEDIFTHFWSRDATEIFRGYLPRFTMPPVGLKLRKTSDDHKTWVKGLTSTHNVTMAESFVGKWGVESDKVQPLLQDIWDGFVSSKVFVPVQLKGQRGNALPGTNGVFQIDSTMLGLKPINRRFKCNTCGRVHSRRTPQLCCTVSRCPGKLMEEEPPADDYNVSMLERTFRMVRAREHSAQVPSADRADLERSFKSEEGINCLVATPTLELGVDIGALDMALMRNMPPLPSNYWQRAGRAGRRHRMAVIFTYCRRSAHDEYFFDDPNKILSGAIYPPSFNLRNPVMVEKHVHAATLTELHRLKSSLSDAEDRQQIESAIQESFPPFIANYIFDEGNHFKKQSPDFGPLSQVLDKNRDYLHSQIASIFQQNWPEGSKGDVDDVRIREILSKTHLDLRKQIKVFHERLLWALRTKWRLQDANKDKAVLDDFDKRLLRACDDYISSLLRRDLDHYALSVLGREGFLPGYAVNTGSVTGFAERGFSRSYERKTFEINRAGAIAVREFVPGNLIYANGGKYQVSVIKFPFTDQTIQPDAYVVDLESMATSEMDKKPDAYNKDPATVLALPVSDVNLGFASHVSDEEVSRFRLPVTMVGQLRKEHRGIDVHRIGEKQVQFRHGQRLTLINIGPSDKVRKGDVGFPICSVCGGCRSPYASDLELNKFKELHQKKCGKEPGNFALSSDSLVDGLLFMDLDNIQEAVNLLEGLRFAATITLDMEESDLQIVHFPRNDGRCDSFLYDPMPGGSGLLNQMLERWEELVKVGRASLNGCPSECPQSCYDCLRSYHNLYYHAQLDRHLAERLMGELEHVPKKTGSTPPAVGEDRTEEGSTNLPEHRLALILKERGFTQFKPQQRIEVNVSTIQYTYPDFYYEDPSKGVRIALYLDGMSKGLHGSAESQLKDHFIRAKLQSMGFVVIVIPATSLNVDTEMDMFMEIVGQNLG